MIERSRLDAIREEHTVSGAHRLVTTPFPRWIPAEVRKTGEKLSEAAARDQIGDWLVGRKTARKPRGR
jgi:hypothetical protein